MYMESVIWQWMNRLNIVGTFLQVFFISQFTDGIYKICWYWWHVKHADTFNDHSHILHITNSQHFVTIYFSYKWKQMHSSHLNVTNIIYIINVLRHSFRWSLSVSLCFVWSCWDSECEEKSASQLKIIIKNVIFFCFKWVAKWWSKLLYTVFAI